MLPASSSLDSGLAQSSSSSSKKLFMAKLLDRDIQHERLYPLPAVFDESSIDSRIESILQERIGKESAADEYTDISLSRESRSKLMQHDNNNNNNNFATVEGTGDTAKSIEGFQKSMYSSALSAVDDTLEQLQIWKDKRNAARETQCLEDDDDDISVEEANNKFSELIDECIRDNPNTPANAVLMEREETQERLQKLTEIKSKSDSESFGKENHFDVSILSSQYTDIANYKSKAASKNTLADKLQEEGAQLDEDFKKLQNQLLSCGDELDDFISNNS